MGNTQSISRFFKGQLDEVRISNTVLNRSQFHLNPLAGARLGQPVFTTISHEGRDRPALQFNRLSGGTTNEENVYTSEGYSYTVQISLDLIDWLEGAIDLSFTTPIDNGDGTETVTAFLSDEDPDPAKGYVRVQVSE